jgi:hypothetical protein
MTTDVLERPDVGGEVEQVFVTLTVADQLCGVPVLGVRDILGEQSITRIPLAPRQPEPARADRHRDRPAPAAQSSAAARGSQADVGRRRTGR